MARIDSIQQSLQSLRKSFGAILFVCGALLVMPQGSVFGNEWLREIFPRQFEQPATAESLTDIPLETLAEIEFNPDVVGASKFKQKMAEAPSSVSVVSSDEIKRYGYRTLADLLRSVSGLHVSYDRNYAFLGVRGVNLGDFNGRVLVLVDGHRINNNITDGAKIDTAFILDVDLIERVEIIRGPGSVLYGNNAFFGVINVITRNGAAMKGAEVSGEYAAFDTFKGRLSYGNKFKNGLELLLSGTLYDSDGDEHLFHREFKTPSQNGGIANGLDDDQFGSFFGKVGYHDFTLVGGFIRREKGNPTAQFSTTFNDPRLRTIDDQSFVNLKYAREFPESVDVIAQIYYDRNDFEIGYPFAPQLLKEEQTGESWGTEVQLNKRICDDRHLLTFGAEFRDVFRQDLRVFNPGTGAVSADFEDDRQNIGLYTQGEFALITNILHLNGGIRYDHYNDFDDTFNPRLALIYNPCASSTLKAIYGTAFRTPNFLELILAGFGSLDPEEITTYELVYEWTFGQNLRSSIAGFYNRMDDLILFESGRFQNFDVDARGLEWAIEGLWANGIRGRASYTIQETEKRSSRLDLPDSPNHLLKFNVTAPVIREKVFAALEYQFTSMRRSLHNTTGSGGQPLTVQGADVGGFGVLNFTLFAHNIVKNLECSASIYNILDRRYDDPATRFHTQDTIEQDGRTFRLKLTYRF